MGFGFIIAIILIKYKPIYEVSMSGEKIGFIENKNAFIENLRKEVEIDGIEIFHPSANQKQRNTLVKYTKENDLYISGGSDYHGKSKPDIEIGIGRGDLNISKKILNWL